MRRDIAERVNESILECYFKVHASIDIVREGASADERKEYCRAAGKVLGYMLLDVLEPIYAEYPDLRPDLLK